MRVLITGGQGQLGRALRTVYEAAEGNEVRAPGHDELDAADTERSRAVLADFKPELLIHAGAATDVDGCETRVEEAFRANALGTRYLALLAAVQNIPLVYVSTNFVFDGRKAAPYHEWDQPNPLSVYGHSKLAGEQEVRRHAPRHFIVRTAQVYDARGRNFMRTMLRLADEGRTPLRIVDDQRGQPTFAADLAAGIATLVRTQAYGTYHLTNGGACSWYEWAGEIFRQLGRDVPIEPVPATAFPRPAAVPANGVLENWAAAALGVTLPDWRDGLRRCLAELEPAAPRAGHAGTAAR